MRVKLKEPGVHEDSAAQIEILAGADSWRSLRIRLDPGTRQELVPNGIAALPHGQRSNPRDTAGAMSQENVESLREAYELLNNEFEALKRGELDALLAFFDPDVVIEYVDAPDPERYEGHEGVRKWFHDSFGVWESVFIEAEEFVEVGDWTVVQLRGRVRGERSGADLEVRLTATHRFRDGKVVHDRVYLDREEALEAAGLSE